LQQARHLCLGLVQVLDQGPAGDQVHAQPGQGAVIAGLGLLQLGQLGVGLGDLGLNGGDLAARLVHGPVDGGQGLLSGDHVGTCGLLRDHQRVMAPPVVFIS
jgi:hypothetical protein